MSASSWQFFLLLIILSIVVEGFFSMMEMACVSFNKVRLHYYESQGNKRAKWISKLLAKPATLFGTTLIGVNIAMEFGSECARRFYLALGVSPDWAPLSQILLVILFAELSPLFAARRYAEHVSMAGIPLIYVFSKLMTPFVLILNSICHLIHIIFRIPFKQGTYLITREELQKAIEERDDTSSTDQGDFDAVVANIFSLKNKMAKDLMKPLEKILLIPSSCQVAHVHEALHGEYFPFLPVYHISKQNIVAIVYPRDLLKASSDEQIRNFSKQPWFILEKNSILQILKQFRRNNQNVAVVLNHSGLAVGILSLDMIVEEIFGSKQHKRVSMEKVTFKDQVIIEKTFPGFVKVKDINKKLNIELPLNKEISLEEFMTAEMGHKISTGDTLRVGEFELTVEEAGLLKGTKISVKTVF
jgi:putative hemolysin